MSFVDENTWIYIVLSSLLFSFSAPTKTVHLEITLNIDFTIIHTEQEKKQEKHSLLQKVKYQKKAFLYKSDESFISCFRRSIVMFF